MEIKKEDMQCSIEWKIKSHKDFGVLAKAWSYDGKWMWNVYAHIAETHPLFSNPGKAKDLPFHYGCTYDEIRTASPSEGIVYDWQKERKTLVVGSDYAHLHDDYDGHPSGFDGVPYFILSDCNALVDALLAELDKDNGNG